MTSESQSWQLCSMGGSFCEDAASMSLFASVMTLRQFTDMHKPHLELVRTKGRETNKRSGPRGAWARRTKNQKYSEANKQADSRTDRHTGSTHTQTQTETETEADTETETETQTPTKT